MRLQATALLSDILDKRQDLDMAFDRHVKGLEGRDRGFVRMAVATTLRHLNRIDGVIDEFADKEPSPQMRNLLRIGITQVLYMDVPDHAAVDETVNQVSQRQRGFVNACLRHVIRNRDMILQADYDLPDNLPEWLFAIWQADYGDDMAGQLAGISATQAATDISGKDGSNERLADGVAVIDALDADHWVQDWAAAQPVVMLGDIQGLDVIDACAAPGGKAMQLAAAGANLIALDRSAKRLKRVHENLERTDLKAEVIETDILKYMPKHPVDVVLLDAPCSATGTIRRHPDLPWIKAAQDIAKLTDLQARMLRHVPDWIKPGGLLMYCTCSLQKAEGEEQISKFLSENDQFELVTERRILPMEKDGGCDGFYIALMRRIP